MNEGTKIEIDRFIAAAEALLERKPSRRSKPRQKTLFAGGGPLSLLVLNALVDTADERGMEVVYLEFDLFDVARGPRRLIVSVLSGDIHVTYADCVLWAAENGGCPVIVPRNGTRGFFELEADKLLHRQGCPAASLDSGMDLATIQLRERASTMPGGQGTLLDTAMAAAA